MTFVFGPLKAFHGFFMFSRYNHILLLLGIPLIVFSVISGITGSFANSTWEKAALREPPPTIIISAPLINTVARPTLYIKTKAVSNTDSVRLTIYNQSTVLGTFYDSIDNYIDLSNYEGTEINLTIKATDKNNLTTTSNPIPIFVESSHRLQEIFQASDRILDFNYNKLLVTDENGYSHPRIIDIKNGVTENINFPDSTIMGYLTSFGSICESRLNGSSTLYETKSGKVNYLGKFQGGSLKVAGNYCIWEVNYQKDIYTIEDTIFLRNIEAEQTSIVTTQGDSNSDVAENGIVVFIDSANVFKYDKGTISRITKIDAVIDASPLTDGVNIAYYERFSPFDAAYLQKPTGNRISLWNAIRGIAPKPYLNYQVNNKYCAYVDMPIKNVISSSLFVWELRILDTLGNSILLDSLPRSLLMTLDLLSPKADVMYFRPYRTLALFKGDTTRISSALGKTYYRDSSWYIAIGRSLFKVVLDPGQDMISNSRLFMAKDTPYYYKISDFTAQFSGPGQLVKIKFTSLPVKGTIKKAGAPVNINDEIGIADINTLSFVPSPGFAGNDSLRWNAYDGFTYTPADALMSLIIQAKPEQPELVGLADSYCNTAGLQKIKIANFPDPLNGYTVNVSLDTSGLAVTSSDSSFSFNTNSYVAGNHMIKTTFTNIAGNTTDTAFIYIKTEVTPIVRVSSDIINVVNLSLPVNITATNYEAGGTSPLYTFAKDRSFTDILQSEGANNKLVLNPNTLNIGNNWIYTRMKTSETCYSIQFAIDSINITRDAITGIIDPDNPSRIITVIPNPFKNDIYIGGLNPAKKYSFSLYPVSGQRLFTKTSSGSTHVTISDTRVAGGLYLLTIFDASKGRMLGTMKLIKE